MRMRINNDWSLDIEDICVSLNQHGVWGKESKKQGQDYIKNKWYFNGIKEALLRMVQLDIQGLDSVKNIARRQDDLESTIKSLPFEESYIYDRTHI